MKRNFNWILIAIIAVVVVGAAILAAFLLTPKTPDYTFPPYVDTYEKSKSYTSQDPNIVLDGFLNDAAWNDQRWLDVKHVTDSAIGVKMTSYFGTDGLYMAFDVDDYGVFFDEKRDAAYNSGIQLYISSLDGAKNITGHGYEISLAAGGQVKVKKYTGQMYELYLGRVYTEAVVKGELNSEDAKGYTMEAYIDYDLLGEDCKQVYANAAIVRSMAETGSDRQWYSFGQNDRGAAWTRAETWWTFGEEGLVAYDVTAETGDHGAVDGKPYVPGGDDYTFRIVPNQGYYAKQVMLGTEDVTSALYYIDGKTYCTTENVQSDLDIQVTFVQVPGVTMHVSGKVSSADGAVTGAKVWAVLGGYEQALSVDAEGNYSGTIPAAEGMQLFVAAEGFVPKALAAQEGENNILLEKMYFGENTETERKTANQTMWDLNRLYLNRVRLKTTDYAMELVNSQVYSNSIYASAKLKTDVKQGVDTRAGFSFYVNKELSLFVALTMNGEVNQYNPEGKVNCTIQLITEVNGERFWGPGGIIVPIENQEKIMEMAAGEGVPISVHYSKGAIDVWVDGQQIGYGIYSKDENGYNRLSEDTAVAVGLQCWGSRAVYEDLHFDGNYPPRMYPSAPNWDLSRLGSGIAVSESNNSWSSAMLSTNYYNKLCMTANVPLVALSGEDLRAGFLLKNSQGKEIFVALTANGEKSAHNPNGDLYYTVQVISGGMASWKVDGKITDVRGWEELKALAGNGGVPMTVYIEDGRLTIGVNGYLIAEDVIPLDKDGSRILAGNVLVAPGLATARTSLTFTNVSWSTSRPSLKDPSLRDWDVSKADKGIYTRTTQSGWASLFLAKEYAASAGVSAKLPLVTQEGKDLRAGFVFRNEKGVEVFVSLTANGEVNDNNPNGDLYYTVQVISGGYASWKVDGRITDIRSWNELHQLAKEDGIPVTAYMENGKLTIGINGYIIAEDVIPLAPEGGNILGENTNVQVGLATTALSLTYNQVELLDAKPSLKDPSFRDWDVSKADKGIYTRTTQSGWASLFLAKEYAASAGVSAKLPLVTQEGKDLRAGFVFRNEKGVEVFVSLTANGEKNTNNPNGDLYYTVQVISGGYASWKVEGAIADIRGWNELHELAKKGGIPVTAYMENGKLTVGINGYLVAEDVIPLAPEGGNILGENTAVKAGLATAGVAQVYHKVEVLETKPALQNPSLREWDVSKAEEGTYIRKTEAGWASLLLSEDYAQKAGVSANLPLLGEKGKDVRAGFVFRNNKGVEVFVSLTANGEVNDNNPNGDLYYTVQVISGGYASWKVEGAIADIRGWNELHELAEKGGIPVTAYMEDGKLTVGINGYIIAEDVIPLAPEGGNILGENTAVKAGLACAGVAQAYHRVEVLTSEPTLKDPSLRQWDVSKAEEGTYSRKDETGWASLFLTKEYAASAGVSAKLPHTAQEGKDLRAGFVFRNEKGVEVFVSLTANGEKNTNNPGGDLYYTVQVISGGYASWKVDGRITDIRSWNELHQLAKEDGIPVTAYMENGKLTIGINGYIIAEDVIPLAPEGGNILGENTDVQVGLATTALSLTYNQVELLDAKPSLKDPSLRDWDVSKADKGIYTRTTQTGWASLLLSEDYAQKVGVSANLPLLGEKGKDVRAGFVFRNNKGVEVFVSLTANGEVNDNNPNGDLYYTVQVISGGYASWKVEGAIADIRGWNELHELAEKGGIPVTAYMENGKLTVGINGYIIAEDVIPLAPEGGNILGENTAVKAGLACAGVAQVYHRVEVLTSEPTLKDPSLRQWDVSKAEEGTYSRKDETGWASLFLTEDYAQQAGISANLPMIAQAGKDIRAGFVFRNNKGVEVFVSLTANGEVNDNNPNGDLYYTVQVISGGMASWKVEGSIVDVRTWNELHDLAVNGGIPVTAYMEDGKLTIGINGYLVAEDVIPLNTDGNPILGDNTAVKAGLACTGVAQTYHNAETLDAKPVLKDSNLRGWDLSKLSDGEASRVEKTTRAEVTLWKPFREQYYLTSKIVLPAAQEDIRAGYRFSDSDGNKIFAALLQNADGTFAVQMIATPATGGFFWTWNYRLNNVGSIPEGGLPFGVAYDKGVFSIWVNDTKIGSNIAPEINGTAVFTEEDLVCAGLECWSTTAQFYALAAYDINDAPQEEAVGTEMQINEGYTTADKYVVLSARIRSLTELKHDWSRNVVLSVSGIANWQNYAFQMVYGTSSEKNLIKLNNNLGYDGQTVLQEQWYNNAKLENLFAENGIEIKLVRMDTKAYLLADMGDGFEQIGTMLLPGSAPTQLKLYAPNMDVRMTRVHIETGLDAAKEAMASTRPDVLVSANAAASSTLIPGDYENANYAVLQANIKALDPITYDWNSNIVVSVSGNAKWDKYDFQILYGTSATRNLVKLTNNTAGTFDGIKVTQDQNINNPAFEKPFTEEGMDIKVVRLNTWAYLLADMGDGYMLVGKMYIPENQATQFSVYNSKMGVQISNYSVTTGKDAALKALDGITLDVAVMDNAFAVPVGTTQWNLEGKVSFKNFSVTDDYRLFVSSFKTEWRRMSIAYILGQRTWKGQSVAQIAGNWGSANIPDADHLTGDGLWTRFVRDGANLSLYVSTDRENWSYVYACDNCGTADSVVYVFESVNQDASISDLKIRTGLPGADEGEDPETGAGPENPERTVESIALKDLPYQVIYRAGNALQIEDASYGVYYDNGDVEFYDITPEMCSQVDMTQSGAQTVYVTVFHDGFEAQLSFDIYVIGDPVEYEPAID